MTAAITRLKRLRQEAWDQLDQLLVQAEKHGADEKLAYRILEASIRLAAVTRVLRERQGGKRVPKPQ